MLEIFENFRKKKVCHSERSEESNIHAVSGFFTPLRSVQNDISQKLPLNNLEQKIEELANDFENGSSVIALKALKIFTEEIESVILSLSKDEIEKFKNKIINAKPAMFALRNVMEYAFMLNQNGNHPHEIRNEIQNKMKLASENIIDKASHYLKDNSFHSIATCSYSSTALNLFKQLKSLNYEFKVLALESKWNGRDYSKKIFDECKNLMIEVQILSPEELIANEFDCSIIGADSVIPDIGIVNGLPSKLFSNIVKDRSKPLFVIAESFKMTEDKHLADGFEFVPMENITAIFIDSLFEECTNQMY